MPYSECDTVHYDPMHPMPVMERSGLFGELTPAAVTEPLACTGPDAHTPLLMVELRHLGGAMARGSDDAVKPRDAAF